MMTTIYRIEIPVPLPVRVTNCYYIKDSIPTLVDAGINTRKGLQVVRSDIEKAGGSLSGIRRIVLTHCHIDHMGLAGKITEISGADVYLHELDRNIIIGGTVEQINQKREEFFRFFISTGVPDNLFETSIEAMLCRYRKFVCPLFRENILNGDEVLRFDDFQLEVVHTPGHTAGSICLFDRAQGFLFSGDTLLEKISPISLPEPFVSASLNGCGCLERYQTSLERIKSMPLKRILPGHGPCFGNHKKHVVRILVHHLRQREDILRAFRSKQNGCRKSRWSTPFDIAEQVFPSLSTTNIFLCLYSICGHLEMLEKEKNITSQKMGELRLYRLV
ncbi:MAG: MBL fold metallo-hydrolase [Thermodesulfobacteriota bacterium]|nr:MBL fold metallo-hydrolase [Thermodesulfobacteriota bacterium]